MISETFRNRDVPEVSIAIEEASAGRLALHGGFAKFLMAQRSVEGASSVPAMRDWSLHCSNTDQQIGG